MKREAEFIKRIEDLEDRLREAEKAVQFVEKYEEGRVPSDS